MNMPLSNRNSLRRPRQQGAVLIFTLWLLAAIGVMSAAIAGEIRLAARSVIHQVEHLTVRADILSGVNIALLELVLSRMPEPAGSAGNVGADSPGTPLLRFDGRKLTTAYEQPSTINIRIYDHAGKINLRRLSPGQMRILLEKLLGRDRKKINLMIDAWQDWQDADDMRRLHGAEKEDYLRLGLPYGPRNAPLETVEELLLIRDFAEVFYGLDLNTVFTIHGAHTGINPNLATREALALIPGLDDEELIEDILELRQAQEIRSAADLAFILDPVRMALVRPWLAFATSNYYTIAVYHQPMDQPAPTHAHQLQVQLRGTELPKILQVRPFGRLPSE